MNRVIPAVLAGGVAGTVLRWAVGELEWSAAASLLVVNTVASGVLGMVVAVWRDREHPARLALAVGFCGGLSTFSGLAVELAQQLDRGDPWDAVVLLVASLVLGGGALWWAGGRVVIAVLFVVTAAAGTLVRWQASLSVPVRAIGTLAVNVGGAFALGLLSTASADSQLVGGVAGLGAMTTFSTLIAETIELDEISRDLAVRYVAATFILGVGAAWIGLQLA